MSRPLPLRRSALLLFLMASAALLLAQVFSERPLAGVLLGALAVEFLANRGGAGWSPGERGRRDLALGLGAGAAAIGIVALLGVLSGKARLLLWSLDITGLVTGLLGALALSFRDELWLRWATGRLLAPHAAPGVVLATQVGLGVGLVLGDPRWTPGALALALGLGLLSTTLLRATGGLVASVAAATAVRSLAHPTPLGVELRWASGSLASLELASGLPAWALAGSLGLVALAAWRLSPR
ncbi:MAG: hypothetical protein MUF64_30830 [Polyangiaceae bacterium]|nr:hypothetical protein [Polyangiaceae bacterium]